MAERQETSHTPAEAAADSHRGRVSRVARKLGWWGFGTAVVGAGLYFAGTLLAPIIPVTAVTVAAMNYGRVAAKLLLGLGAVLGIAGAGKGLVDVARS